MNKYIKNISISVIALSMIVIAVSFLIDNHIRGYYKDVSQYQYMTQSGNLEDCTFHGGVWALSNNWESECLENQCQYNQNLVQEFQNNLDEIRYEGDREYYMNELYEAESDLQECLDQCKENMFECKAK
tara:strand:- start:449 stop:835 length:387 start_codon:yes stop_codon:yes gene_type:complete